MGFAWDMQTPMLGKKRKAAMLDSDSRGDQGDLRDEGDDDRDKR